MRLPLNASQFITINRHTGSWRYIAVGDGVKETYSDRCSPTLDTPHGHCHHTHAHVMLTDNVPQGGLNCSTSAGCSNSVRLTFGKLSHIYLQATRSVWLVLFLVPSEKVCVNSTSSIRQMALHYYFYVWLVRSGFTPFLVFQVLS